MAGTIRRKPPAPLTGFDVKPRPKRKPPQVNPTPPVDMPDPIPAKLGAPTGTIGGPLQIAYGRGGPWSEVNRYDPSFLRWGTEYGVKPSMLKAMAVVESGGQMIPNGNGFPNWGLMQLTSQEFGSGYFSSWDQAAKDLGVSIKSADGQIAVAAYVLGGRSGLRGSPEEIFLSSYYPIQGGLDVKGPDGHTQRQYLDDMHELMRQIDAAAGGTTPAPQPDPNPEQPMGDVLDLLYGGKPYDITAVYGQLVTWSCPGCYDYFTAYGLDTRHHWAYDVSAHAGDGAPLYAPFDGLVVCAGTDNGSGAWGTGCAAFPRMNNYGGRPSGAGAGRLELLHADGDRSLILGHALSSRVSPGSRVKAGDLLGQQGGMNASHVHCEGRYANGTRIGDPRKLFGGGPMPVSRIPYDFEDNPNLFEVEVVADTLAVRQRADPQAPELDGSPYKKGETFQAVCLVPGNDGRPWWLGTLDGRVPANGTRSNAFPKGF